MTVEHGLERRYHIADHVFGRIVQQRGKPHAQIHARVLVPNHGFDQQRMLRDREDVCADGLAVPAGDEGEAVGDVLDLDVERRRIQEVEAASGAVLGVVTRNRMGCEVLCTDLLFIADVDVPELEDATARGGAPGDGSGASGGGGSRPPRRPGSGVGGFFRRLLSGEPAPTPMTPSDATDDEVADAVPASPRPGGTSVAECLACEPVWEFARRHPELGVRVYRTAAGFRVIVTGVAASPGSDRARALLTELGSDPLYVELCATHDSYRARLTPKPFRVGARALPVSWPFADAGAVDRYEEWLSQYDGRSSGHAVCRLVSVSGPEPGPDESRLVGLHDTRCRVGERLPLA